MSTRLFFISFIFVITTSVSISAQTVSVITKKNSIRESCRFFAPVKTTVHYSDLLEVISQEGDWFQVKFKEIQGCIHKSAVEEKSISLSKIVSSGSQSASDDEVAIAGKGFNPQVESAYKRDNPGLNFQAVNRIENYNVSDSALKNFIQSGRLISSD
ncbi:hypothetical protein MYX76_12130 [Desulfobacterota bacterium AH_259_B03_O07]|nr:hypothetical protein [Desulfobacterota bacterium AH_259_B03_O07]